YITCLFRGARCRVYSGRSCCFGYYCRRDFPGSIFGTCSRRNF
uniref:Tachystatin-B2 n=1 Tax=Tachypleus tridentatus TaxID=6853 RepID=TACB2_TACTR|nr:RecName: Full=Tachystatin-B2 [Tachypleus tridentatus]2DCW_A Chain A, Tachystatin-B2 [Tachypleus tridentatus]